MSVVTGLALAIGLLIVAPYLAHRLRRRRAEERPFAPARLVPPAPPKARRRAQLEDRALFAIRALSILFLALLGASPLVRCSRLALQRSGGASVSLAIVIDDSMSMRAKDASERTRFSRAKEGARQLLASAREGDAVAVVLAGAPSRVALAATNDLGAARATIDALQESDRGTDLEGSVTVARALIGQLPQVDKRIVVLSDLADGNPDGPPLGQGSAIPVWVAMPELREPGQDCGIRLADRAGIRVRVEVVCSSASAAQAREVVIRAGDKTLARAPLPKTATGDVVLRLPDDDASELTAALSGADAIASDDAAIVVTEAGPGTVAIVADTADEAAATGGAPIVEQALSALHLDIAVRPIPALPDRVEDLSAFAGIIVDDPPGFTPEQRRALGAFIEGGGVALVALGPRSAAAPLGASLEPLLAHAVSWSSSPSPGIDPDKVASALAESAPSLVDLAAKGRIAIGAEDTGAFEPLLSWKDGAPLLTRRGSGRGEAWLSTLPFAVDTSDLTLRPGFLALLDAFVAEARQRAVPRRGDVGVPWAFSGARTVAIEGPGGPVPASRDGLSWRAVPTLTGSYHVVVDGKNELRVAAPIAREMDLRPRAGESSASASPLGDSHAAVDVSWAIALALLAFVAAELALRALTRARQESDRTAPLP